MMRELLTQVRTAVVATLALAVILCFIYPMAVWGSAHALFSDQANGSLITARDGKILGSRLIGQNFASPKYFQSRPSGAGKGYDPVNSGGTNLGPTSQKEIDAVRQAAESYRKANGLGADVKIPVDAVTASGSGLDPHISPRNAELQAPRVAKERGLSEDKVRALIKEYTSGPDLGIFGDAGVNVLELNLALDGVGATPAG